MTVAFCISIDTQHISFGSQLVNKFLEKQVALDQQVPPIKQPCLISYQTGTVAFSAWILQGLEA